MSTETQQLQPMYFNALGQPYGSEPSAKAGMTQRSLPRSEYEIRQYGEGFIIAKKGAHIPRPPAVPPQAPPVVAPAPPPEPAAQAKPEEKYFLVRFYPASDNNQPVQVSLSNYGETLVFQRDQEVIVPGRFINVANDALTPVWKQEPGKDRKVERNLMAFPFQILGETTREEFLRRRNEGTRKQLEKRQIQA